MALAGLLAVPAAGGQLWLLAVTTALAVGAGAEAHARAHPSFGASWSRRLDGFWIGPALGLLAIAPQAAQLGSVEGRLVALGGAVGVGLMLLLQDRELEERADDRWGPLVFALLLYVVAFGLFSLLFGIREPIWLVSLGCGGCAALLALALFRSSRARRERVLLYAVLIGLAVAEITLALGGWVATGLLGGAFLLLFFYVAAGLVQALLDGTLDGRLVFEYACVGLVGLALILWTSPWHA